MAEPMISVVVPMYKVEQYIKLCVDSILAQTFTDFELILVDDASPDNCFDICQKLYGGNEKVRIIRHEENRGLGPTRNTGMKHARGKYIYFVDSDDFILPDALEKLFTAAEKTNAQVVHAAGWYELHQNEPLPIRQENLHLEWDKFSTEGFLPPNIAYRIDEHWRRNSIWPMAWLCLFRRDFLQTNRLEFLPILSEDEPFHFALLCLTERYYIIREALYVYRRRAGSIMKTKNPTQLVKAINSIAIGSDYISHFLDQMPRLDNYDLWRQSIMDEFFKRFTNNHTKSYYENLAVSPEVDAAIDGTLGKIFGGGKNFVKYFFNYYHLYRRQGELLAEQNRQQSVEISSLIDRAELSPKKIVFDNFAGRGYGCNPKYIAEEILRQNLPYDLVWLVKDINEPMPAKIRKVKHGSLDSVYELATAKVIVTNHKSRLPFPGKKRGQFFIMTWHGGPAFKLIERDIEEKLSSAYVAQSKATSAMTDLMMVECQEQYDEFRRVMWYNGEILTCGLPRNDLFFRRDEKLIARVRNNLRVPEGNKIVMYAPTFRDDHANTDVYKFDAQKILAALTKRFGGKWTLLIRFHPNIAKEKFAQAAFANAINATNYPDMQELILVADALISDYSSVIYDFMISRKPVFIYAKDFDSYPTERGFKPLFFELPYSVNRTEPQLVKAIKTFDDAKLAPKIRKFTDAIKPFDNGHAAEVVVSRIRSAINVNPPPPNQIGAPTEKTPPEDFFRQCMANPIFRNNIDMLMKVPIQEKDAQNIMQTLDFVENKYFYELMDVRPWKPKILDVDSGIDELLASGKSFCRLGDGECFLMQGKDLGFQKHDPRLAEKLLQILSDAQTNCYVGLPRYYWYFRDDVERSGNPYHKRYYTFKIPPVRKFFADHCNESKTYIDACLGAYMSNKSTEFCAARFQKLKTLFNGRKVLIVAGETVFQNITHDFFDGVAQKEILLAPRINAWSKFDEILGKILTYPEDFVVVLILGPTATVLAYELSKLGRVAYDIGHVPKDYDAFLKRADRSSGAIGKFYAPD